MKTEQRLKFLLQASLLSVGKTLNLLLCDEFAFVQPNLAEEFWASNYPTISASKHSKIIIISTPNGMFNLFHRLWIGAENNKNDFVHTKITWRDVPGRDDEWARRERAILSDQLFRQEHEVIFLGSSSTLINTTVLETLINGFQDPASVELEGKFRIFDQPKEGKQYVCGVDVGEGTGGDDSVVQVLSLDQTNPIKFTQVATYSSNLIETHVFAELVNRIGLYYNNAYIMCENNAIGNTVISKLWYEHGNMNVICYSPEKSGKKSIGIRATSATKPKACILMKRLIEFGNVNIIDKLTIEQLSAFVEEKGKYFGKTMHDDCVSALYWALFITETNVLEDVSLGKNIVGEESKGWGILADYENSEDNWNWLTNDMFT